MGVVDRAVKWGAWAASQKHRIVLVWSECGHVSRNHARQEAEWNSARRRMDGFRLWFGLRQWAEWRGVGLRFCLIGFNIQGGSRVMVGLWRSA